MDSARSTSFFQGGLSDAQVSKLLKQCLPEGDQGAQATRPVDALLDRISRPDGPAWFAGHAVTWLKLTPSPEAALIERKPGIGELRELKEACKGIPSSSEDAWLISVAGYFSALAAALAHHGELITEQPRSECRAVFEDLERAFWSPWKELFRAARERLPAPDAREAERPAP